jgi:hypothetical protein
MKQQQQTLALATYPTRPKLFVLRFLELLNHAEAAREIGLTGCWLLTVIALEEDRRWYRPVCLRNHELQTRLGGLAVETVREIRTACVDAGWLHYVKGHRGQAPTYWVLIPERERAAYDEITYGEQICGGKNGVSSTRNDTEVPPETPPRIKNPIPIPIPPPPTGEAATAMGELVVLLEQAGVEVDPDTVVSRALGQGRTVAEIRARIEAYHERNSQDSLSPGFLVMTLTRRSYVGKPPTWGWPQLSPEAAEKVKAAEAARVRAEAAAEQDRRLAAENRRIERIRQLRFEFRDQIGSLTPAQLAERYPVPEPLRQRLARAPGGGIRDDGLHVEVLEIVAAHLSSGGRRN